MNTERSSLALVMKPGTPMLEIQALTTNTLALSGLGAFCVRWANGPLTLRAYARGTAAEQLTTLGLISELVRGT